MTVRQKILSFLVCAFTFIFIPDALANSSLGQVIQINTSFRYVVGKPTWLIIIRDEDNGQVIPYIFHVDQRDNTWLAFTFGHHYRINASKIVFGPRATINDFCHLEDGIVSNKSMIITLTGDLTPAKSTSTCRVTAFQDTGEFNLPSDQ